MAAPEDLNMEAFQTKMRAWVDEISTKQTENINKQAENLNARIDELKESNKKQLEEQSENVNNKLKQQFENFKQDTIRITESRRIEE